MKNIGVALLSRLLALAGIIVAAVPLVHADPSPFPWEWTGLLIGSVVVYFGTYTEEYRSWRLAGSDGHPHDVDLYRRFIDLLPPTRFQDFFQNFDFGNSFPASEIEPLNQFVDRWKLANVEFRDRKLDAARRAAVATGTALAEAIAFRTRPLPSGHMTVKLAGAAERLESVVEDARVINEAARAFSRDYQAFLRLGRRRLTIR